MTTAHQGPAQAQPQAAPILVATRDESLIPTLTKMLGSSCPIHRGQSIDQAFELVQNDPFGVLITDLTSEGREIMEITRILSTYSPNLVCIVIGERDHAHDLMALVNSGYIYRFLLKPFTVGQTRLTVQAALRQHHTLSRNPPRPPLPPPPSQIEKEEGTGESDALRDVLEDTLKDNQQLLRFGGAALVVAVALVLTWYLSVRSDEAPPVEQFATTEPPVPTLSLVGDEPTRIQPLLQKVGVALHAGRLVAPEEDSALYYYSRILETDPENPDANEGLERLTEIILMRAQRALQDDEFESAIDLVQTARGIRPEHPGIEAIDKLIHSYAERWLAQAEEPSSDSADAALIRLARTRKQDMLRSQRQAETATASAESGSQTPKPARQARVSEPKTPSATEPSSTAPESSAAGNNAEQQPPVRATQEQAPEAAPAAAPVDSTPDLTQLQLARVEPPLEASDAPGQVSTMINDISRLANRRMDEGRLLEPAGDSAKFYVQALLQAAPDHPAVSRDRDRLASLFEIQARTAMADQRPGVSEHWVLEAEGLKIPALAVSTSTEDLERVHSASAATAGVAQRPPRAATMEPVPVSELEFKRYVEPRFPRSAHARGIAGWVELDFTVGTEGRTKNIEIGEAQPQDLFEEAALDAVQRWEFEPELVNGRPAEKRVKVWVRFEIE